MRRCSPIQVGHFLARLVCLLGVLAPSYVGADEFVSNDWQFQIAPYAWALAADGDTTVQGQKSDLDLSFQDIVDELNYGLMLEGEARKGRIGVFTNILYANLGKNEESGGTTIDPDINLFWGSFAGFYRLGPWDLDSEAGGDGPQLIVDPYAGVRYTYLDVDLDVSPGGDFGGDEQWVDPIVGLRTIWQLTPRWGVTAGGDIGGFGVGSDFQWMATGLIRYRFGLFGDDDAQFGAGYRALHQDYSDGSGANKFEWDVTLHGPVFTVGIEF
jgi:hypothetical protein